MDNIRAFGVADYIAFFATVTISFSIGVFFAVRDRKRNTPANYFLAEGKSGILSVMLSFIVSFQSSLMIIGTPVEVYMYGLKSMFELVGVIVAFVVSGIIIVPVFHPLEITSSYKYFSLRFEGNAVRYLALFAGVAYNTFYMGSVTFGTCLALQVVMGIPYWATIILYMMVAIIYTSIGGIKAVIWSDVFQLVMMLTGVLALLIKSTTDSGGISDILDLSSDRLDMTDFRLDPRIRYQFWNTSIGTITNYFFLTCSQAGIQRVKSTSTVKSARAVYFIAAPLYCLFYLLAALQGVTLFAYYSYKGCDPFQSGMFGNYNELVPVAVLELFQNIPGMAGLFIASLSSAALSTLSSCLSSVSAITYDDVILEKYPNISDMKATFLSKIVVIVYGMVGLILSFAISQMSGTLSAIFMASMGCLTGPSAAIYLLSVTSKRMTSKGVFIGGLCGMAMSFWLIIGQTLTGLTPSDRLPPGPTDQCVPAGTLTSFVTNNKTQPELHRITSTPHLCAASDFERTFTSEASEIVVSKDTELTGLDNMYSISFTLFSLSGFLTTVIVASVISFFTKPPRKIDERCVFSWRKHVLQKASVTHKNSDVTRDVAERFDLITSTT